MSMAQDDDTLWQRMKQDDKIMKREYDSGWWYIMTEDGIGWQNNERGWLRDVDIDKQRMPVNTGWLNKSAAGWQNTHTV
jgi:hypothetical protein